MEVRLDDLRIHSGLSICECTLSRSEVGFKERATACIFPRALNHNICMCSLVQCLSRTMKRLLRVVWQRLAKSHFSALTSLDQRFLDVHIFKCKLSIKPKSISSGSGSSRATSNGRLSVYSEKIPVFIIFLYSGNFFPRYPLLAPYQRRNTEPDGSWPDLCGHFYVLRPLQHRL